MEASDFWKEAVKISVAFPLEEVSVEFQDDWVALGEEERIRMRSVEIFVSSEDIPFWTSREDFV